MFAKGTRSFSRQCVRGTSLSSFSSSVRSSVSQVGTTSARSSSAFILEANTKTSKGTSYAFSGPTKTKAPSASFSTSAPTVKRSKSPTTIQTTIQLSITRPLVISGVTQFGPLIVELVVQEEDEEVSTRTI